MRHVLEIGLLAGVWLALGTVAAADAPRESELAIRDAIKVLEAHKAKTREPSEIDAINHAISQLQRTSESYSPPAVPEIDVKDFTDHTEKYRGKTITLRVFLAEPIFAFQNKNLRDYINGYVNFRTFGPRFERLDMRILIPRGIEVPKAVFGDQIIVKFECGNGDLRLGNVAVSLTRP